MKKNLERLIVMFLIMILSAGMLSGCFFFQELDYDIAEGYDDPEDYVKPEYDFTVSCTEDVTTVSLSDIGYYGDTAQLVYLKPYQYLYGEGDYGLSEERNVAPTVVGEYECETEQTFTIDRYNEDGYDTVYCKFYVVQGREILAGPVYPTEIQPIYTHDEVVKTQGIKGIMCSDIYDPEVSKLSCEHTEINFVVTHMVVPNEIVDENTGEIIETIEYEEHLDENGVGTLVGPQGMINVEMMVHNGKKYYFRTDWFEGYDDTISRYTRENIKVTLIVLEGCDYNQYEQPYFMTYPAARSQAGLYWFAVNTSNEYGAEYWAALMEFVARRYSQEDSAEDAKYGTVESYVMGNEIDYPDDWNVIVNPDIQSIDQEDYAAEYERMLRITNQSFKKVYERNIPLISFTHNWASSGYSRAYAPKDIFDYISLKTLREGNYNWGLAVHPYGSSLPVTDYWGNDANSSEVTGALTTSKITWTNLEVMQLYLEQPIKLCNGEVRSVFVTEGGVSSGNSEGTQYAKDKNMQAAGVAYAYYKCTQLPCIKALNYYHLVDHPTEAASNIYFGLMTQTGVVKPSYDVYKYVDTQYTWEVSDTYLEYIAWSRFENGKRVSYGKTVGNIHEYRETMAILPSKFDWDTRWDESKVIMRRIDEIPAI